MPATRVSATRLGRVVVRLDKHRKDGLEVGAMFGQGLGPDRGVRGGGKLGRIW